MKGKFWLIAAFAMMLAACSKDSGTIDSPVPSEQGNKTVGSTQQPVSFGAYLNRAVTRAGYEGNLGIDQLKTNGFGVLAYYTDDKTYSPDFQPNFMYNTKVAYQTDHWEYNPVRYWPNENSEHDASEGLDRLSFFAYAPHVDVNQLTGYTDENDNPGRGIVALSRNGAIGDPFVYYHVNFNPASQVDFCWGTPRVNMTKQATNQKVEFEFNHALAALNVQIDADIDEVVADASTRIYVRSVSFEGFAERGAFNLNTQPGQVMWHNMTGDDYLDGDKVTVHDGRVNGNEGAAEAVNELPKGLNPVIVQSAKYDNPALTAGVTNATVNLFDNTSVDAPVYVIPTGQPLRISIVYDVETQVDNLPGYLADGITHGSNVENSITKTITLTSGENMRLEAGKKYTVHLHLGMTSVKINADIAEWDNASSANAELPVNADASVAVSGISLNMSSMKLASNGDADIVATVEPSNATNQSINWTSGNPDIVSVVNGKVTAMAVGSTTIHATTVDGNYSESCTVEVVPTTLAALKSVADVYSDDELALYKAMDVDSDGNINISDSQNEILGKKYDATKKIGFIAYIATNSDVDNGVIGSRILVMASNNVSDSKLPWSSIASNNNHPVSEYNFLLDGYSATMAMSGGKFEAKEALESWADSVTKPVGCSEWFMPSIGQWDVILQWIGTTEIEFIQGETLRDQTFLSSSESFDDSPYTIWVCDFMSQSGYFKDTPYKEKRLYYTRAIFAY